MNEYLEDVKVKWDDVEWLRQYRDDIRSDLSNIAPCSDFEIELAKELAEAEEILNNQIKQLEEKQAMARILELLDLVDLVEWLIARRRWSDALAVVEEIRKELNK